LIIRSNQELSSMKHGDFVGGSVNWRWLRDCAKFCPPMTVGQSSAADNQN
jgi:hypothetical protein